MQEFIELKQESMSANEYIAKFTQFLRVTLGIGIGEEDRARKFMEGLNLDFINSIMMTVFLNVAATINAAMTIENHYVAMEKCKGEGSGVRAD